MTGQIPGERREEYAFGVSASRRVHASVIAGLLTAIGIGTMLFGDGYVRDHRLIAVVCWGLAAAALYVSRGAWSRGTAMIIDDTGLWYRDWDLPPVPWRHVAGARAVGIRLRPLLRIDLKDTESFFAMLDSAARRRSRGNALVKGDHLLIPNNAVEKPISEIAVLIRERASG